MDAVNAWILEHAGLAAVVAFVLLMLKDIARDFLLRDAAAKLADADPSNDQIARLQQSAANVLDKIKPPIGGGR